jgi:SAM-dependent methyltransferase
MLTEQAQRHYRGDAGRRYQESKRGLPEQAIPWLAALRARKFAPLIGAEDVVLEYGVGAGWNLAELRCHRKIGSDVADFLETSLRALGIEFVPDTRIIPPAAVDVVMCHHTLEHVLHPPEVLAEIRRLLKPAGRLLLYVPFESEGKYEHFRPDEPNHHLYSWNVQTLGNLVTEAGFEVTQAGLGEFGYSRFSAVWAAKLRLGETGFRSLRRLLHIVRPAFEVRIVATKRPTPG